MRQVYVTGDPICLRLYDANTGQQINHVRAVTIWADVTAASRIELVFDNAANELCELVAAPPAAKSGLPAGARLLAMSLERREDSAAGGSVFRLQMTPYVETGNGVCLDTKAKHLSVAWSVSDAVLSSAYSPDMIIRDGLRAVGEKLGAALVDEMLAQHASALSANNSGRCLLGAQTGRRTNFQFPPPAPAPTAVCDECHGTGEYTCPVTAKRSPCSKGCTPKP